MQLNELTYVYLIGLSIYLYIYLLLLFILCSRNRVILLYLSNCNLFYLSYCNLVYISYCNLFNLFYCNLFNISYRNIFILSYCNLSFHPFFRFLISYSFHHYLPHSPSSNSHSPSSSLFPFINSLPIHYSPSIHLSTNTYFPQPPIKGKARSAAT